VSFQEKSNLAVLVALLLVFGAYFGFVLPGISAGGTVPPASAVGAVLIGPTVVLAVLLIISHGIIALLSPDEAGETDERDQLIQMRADARAGYVLVLGVFSVLLLLFLEIEPFWIANALLGAVAASEIVKSLLRAIAYRRGV
jgi:hypothetical protein